MYHIDVRCGSNRRSTSAGGYGAMPVDRYGAITAVAVPEQCFKHCQEDLQQYGVVSNHRLASGCRAAASAIRTVIITEGG